MLSTVAYEWTTRLYDLGGNPISINYNGYSDKGTTSQIWHGSNRALTYYLNGVDDYSFNLYLDDPASYLVNPLKTVVKVWRKITDTSTNTILYEDDPFYPSFCGVVGYTIKDGESNTVQVKAFNPMWRLQFRFHILNHYLQRNPDTSADYKQSELIWKLIDLINNAFGAASFTGIAQGNFDWSGEPTVAPYFVPKGSNTWANIFDDIMDRAAGSDIFPRYTHNDTNPTLMYFDTYEKVGADKSSTIKFNYHTDTGSNCDNLSEEIQAVPNEFANYLWAVGHGGPNSGKVALDEDNTSSNYGYNAVGIYMRRIDRPETKRITALQPIATAELAQSKWPKFAYNVTVSPAAGIFYGPTFDYQVGDVVALNADRGALQVTNQKQRIYQCSLEISDNNVEISSPLVSKDFYGKVVT